MATDWSVVTVDHVRQACALQRAGTAVPRRPARNTILLMGGHRYPAKFIRGLAYKLATGSPPGDYSGGLETVGFFTALGLTTEHDGTVIGPVAPSATPSLLPTPRVPPTFEPPLAPAPAAPPVPGGKVDQKKALLALLTDRFGTIEKEATFDWLTVPAQAGMTGPVAAVHAALRAHRGHANFATAGRRLNCDFHVPDQKLLVEYDERQHFTLPRGIALGLYPSHCTLHFDRAAWIADCHQTKANDPTPPYRDEQRAFYDALRDLRAAENGFTLVRLRDGAFDWTRPDAGARLDAVLAACGIRPRAAAGPTGRADDRIARLALASHDYRKRDSAGRWDYTEHVARINRLCDGAGCDTILYALYTWDTRSAVPRTAATMFAGTSNLRRVVIEVGDLGANGGNPGLADLSVEVWERGREEPRVIRQRFARGKDGSAGAANFVAELPDRRLAADGVVMVCGETNAVSLVRATKKVYDPRRVNDRLADLGVRVVLNPIHDYMRRYEMKEKRRHYSTGGRWVASVWNVGKGNESATPWTLFRDGAEVTGAVKEIRAPFHDRPDIRVGVVDLV